MRLISMTEAVEAVRAALADGTGTGWIGIDGLGGSGKSTQARRIAVALPGSVVIATDDFARPGTPTWEQDRFARGVLEPLLAGRPGRYRRWPYDSAFALDEVRIPTGVPIIVEGVAATDIAVPVPWDLTIWVETPADVRHQRIADRDPPEVQARWRQEWWPSEDAYVAAQDPRSRADVVVDGSSSALRVGTADRAGGDR